MAKGDEKRTQKMIDTQGETQAANNRMIMGQNYNQYQTPPQGAQNRPGYDPRYYQPDTGGGTTGGGTGGGGAQPRGSGGTGGGGTPPHGGGPPGSGTSGGRMSDEQAQQFFDQMFPGGTVSPQDLEAHRAELEAAGFVLNPNAGGLITDLTLPSGNTVDPIYGAGEGINRKQWLVHPAGAAGTPSGGWGGTDFPGGEGLLGPALGGYRQFINTGGFSPQDIQSIRARANAPIRSTYEQGMDELGRMKNVQGGYMPNYGAAMAKMQRQMSNKIGDQALNTEAELATQIRQGRLAGLQGYGDMGQEINRQGLQAQGMQGQQGLGLIGQQIDKASVPTNYQQALGNINSTISTAGHAVRGVATGGLWA